ncbi:MAG: ATP-binding cassette domain-containing protein [Myxococcota bacterium]|nr:ATP-binding cassette domain-containing protein [Myxococcota bacterium]
MSNDVMIYANDLSKSFGSFRALEKINFQVKRGEIVGFLGPNGAGKSTTMRILTCFISPTGGTARINGHDVFDAPLQVRESLGYLPQRAPLYLEMSVLEYLRFAADLRHLDPETFRRRARSVVEVCGLAQVLGKEIRYLSHGYRQRVGLAQALIHDPPILILDEPTSDLDPNEKSEFLDYLKQIGEERTVLLSTHNLAEVEASCARAIIVSRGRIVADGPLEEIRAKSGRVRYVVSIQESSGDAPYRGRGPLPKKGDVEEALGKVEGVKRLGELPTDDRAHAFELVSEQEVDLRPEVFRMIVEKGWVLLELQRDAQTLEDVFRSLTIGDERRNRRLPGAGDADDEGDHTDAQDHDDGVPADRSAKA